MLVRTDHEDVSRLQTLRALKRRDRHGRRTLHGRGCAFNVLRDPEKATDLVQRAGEGRLQVSSFVVVELLVGTDLRYEGSDGEMRIAILGRKQVDDLLAALERSTHDRIAPARVGHWVLGSGLTPDRRFESLILIGAAPDGTGRVVLEPDGRPPIDAHLISLPAGVGFEWAYWAGPFEGTMTAEGTSLDPGATWTIIGDDGSVIERHRLD